jgi:hypothetical protein
MSHNMIPTLVLTVPLLLASCDCETPTEGGGLEALAATLAIPDGLGEGLPLRGEGIAGITGMEYAPGFPGGQSTFDDRCSVPSDYVIEFRGTGHLSHLGEVTLVFEHCSQIDFTTGNTTYGDGTFAFVAANGDELWGTYGSGTGAPVSATEIGWQDTFVLIGGTGRFAGASGGGVDRGKTHSVTGYTTFETVGHITYDASLRRNR